MNEYMQAVINAVKNGQDVESFWFDGYVRKSRKIVRYIGIETHPVGDMYAFEDADGKKMLTLGGQFTINGIEPIEANRKAIAAAANTAPTAEEKQPEAAESKSLEEISTTAAANTAKVADEAYASGKTVEIAPRRDPNNIYATTSLDYLTDGLYVYVNGNGLKTIFIVVSGSVHGRRFEVRANVAGNLYTAYYMAAAWNVYSSQPTVRRWGTQQQYDTLLAQIQASSDAMHEMMLNS